MRLTSDFWVSAYQRRRNGEGYFTAVVRRGEESAGAIFVTIDRLDGTQDLYGPVPQGLYDEDAAAASGGRMFERLLEAAPSFEIAERLEREKRMDPDFWVVASEARDASHGLVLASAEI